MLFDKIQQKKLKNKPIIIFFLLLILSLILVNIIENKYLIKIIIFSIMFPSLILTLMLYQKNNHSRGKFFSFIGDISYAVYLIHYVVQAMICFLLAYYKVKLNFNSELFFLMYLILIFILSWISFNFFEKPIQKLIRSNF